MPRAKKHTAEQIIGKLRQAELGLSLGRTTAQAKRSRLSCLSVKWNFTCETLAGKGGFTSCPHVYAIAFTKMSCLLTADFYYETLRTLASELL